MRRLWLSVLGLAFLCLPAASSDESNECRAKQLLGPWYIHGIASNCGWMTEFLAKETMTCNVTSQEEGNITITTNCKTEYGEMEVDMRFMKQENGTYLHKSEWGEKIIEKMKTDCKTYFMSCLRDLKENNGKFCEFVSLYGRNSSVPSSVKQSFVDFAMERQIDRDQIFLLEGKDAATQST